MTTLTLELAQTLISETLAFGRAKGFNPLSAVAVDTGGHPIAFARSDGAPAGRFYLAHGKANACIMMGIGGAALANVAQTRPQFAGALNGVYGGQFVPGQGGVLIKNDEGVLLGALGVSGAKPTEDEEAAVHAIKGANLIAVV